MSLSQIALPNSSPEFFLISLSHTHSLPQRHSPNFTHPWTHSPHSLFPRLDSSQTPSPSPSLPAPFLSPSMIHPSQTYSLTPSLTDSVTLSRNLSQTYSLSLYKHYLPLSKTRPSKTNSLLLSWTASLTHGLHKSHALLSLLQRITPSQQALSLPDPLFVDLPLLHTPIQTCSLLQRPNRTPSIQPVKCPSFLTDSIPQTDSFRE